ncbi:unnamed protein product [Arctogadus glacialis]
MAAAAPLSAIPSSSPVVSPQAKWLFKIAQQCRAVKLGLDVVALGPAGHCPDEPGSKVESTTESRASVAATQGPRGVSL